MKGWKCPACGQPVKRVDNHVTLSDESFVWDERTGYFQLDEERENEFVEAIGWKTSCCGHLLSDQEEARVQASYEAGVKAAGYHWQQQLAEVYLHIQAAEQAKKERER